jgi:CHASE3 domain sensor protein
MPDRPPPPAPTPPGFGWVHVLLGMTAAVVAGVGALGYAALLGYSRLAEDRRRDLAAARSLERLVASVRVAESGQRGYLLTGDVGYLKTYDRAREEVPRRLTEARRLAGDGEVDPIAEDVWAKLGELARTIEFAAKGERDRALSEVRSGQGERWMGSIRDLGFRAAEAAEARAEERERRLSAWASVALVAIPCCGALAPALVAAALAGWQRETRTRVRAQAETESAREVGRYHADMLRALSHDLRTPLNAIAQQLSLAEHLCGVGTPDCARVRESLRSVRQSCTAQAALLDEFLQVARAERSSVLSERFPVRKLLDDVAHLVRPEADRKGLALEVDCEPGVEARTDRAKLNRVLLNLAANAVKFTKAGRVRLHAARRPGGVEVRVEDTGVGIGPDARSVPPSPRRAGPARGARSPSSRPTWPRPAARTRVRVNASELVRTA